MYKQKPKTEFIVSFGQRAHAFASDEIECM